MNKTILMGRLTKDPEVKYLQNENSTAMARYTLAVDRRYRKDGKAETDFISCVTFGKNAEFAEKYLKKGLKILVSGRIQTGSYVNQEGNKKENPVAFSLGEEGLKWLGEYDISIEDLLMGKAGTKKETKLEKAQKLILELLTKRKVMCLEELEAELLAYGISSRTGRDARKQLENRLSYDWCQGRKTVALITE